MSSARAEYLFYIAQYKDVRKHHLTEHDPEDISDEKDEKGGEDDNADDSIPPTADDQMPTVNYHYTSLSDANSCTRLLELQAGQGHDLIVCKLEEIDLYARSKYDALSYVWGPPGGESRVIQVDGRRFEIGVKLHCALENLRYADRPRFLWVDAICIDQFNIAERNAQVPLMYEIYQNAACTVCFLGPSIRSTRHMYKMLKDLAKEGKALEAKVPTHEIDVSNTTLPTFLNRPPLNPLTTELAEKYMGDDTIVDLATNEWWHRIWTVQELILSSNAVLMTGRYTIAWEDLRAGVDHGLSAHIWGHVAFGFLVNPVTVPYLSMKALMNRYRHPSQLGSSAVDLLHLLIHCRHRDSTDPRDKIYALLGLLRATHPEALRHEGTDILGVTLDYHHDVVYVYRKTCQELVQKLGNLDVLGVCPKSALPCLPSWATDWSITDRIGSPLMQDSLNRARTTLAAKQTNANARFSDDGASMIITGYELTSIIALAEALPNPVLIAAAGADYRQPRPSLGIPKLEIPAHTGRLGKCWLRFKHHAVAMRLRFGAFKEVAHDASMNLMTIFETLFAWEHFAVSPPPTNPGGKPDTVYWKTLCAGTYKNGSIEETGLLFKTWYDLLQPLRKFMRNHPKFAAKHRFVWFVIYQRATWESYGEFWPYISGSHHRRLGRAANGWLCLLPDETKVGDVIILARGGRVPLVVRSDEKEYYTFVGEAYIDGIMDGEAFDESKCVDIEIR